jgi:hypothetical protein
MSTQDSPAGPMRSRRHRATRLSVANGQRNHARATAESETFSIDDEGCGKKLRS